MLSSGLGLATASLILSRGVVRVVLQVCRAGDFCAGLRCLCPVFAQLGHAKAHVVRERWRALRGSRLRYVDVRTYRTTSTTAGHINTREMNQAGE